MPFDPRTIAIGSYKPREFRIDCLRCRRGTVLDKWHMQRRFGAATTLQECARHVAAAGGCNLAAIPDGPGCSVQVFETDVWTWAKLQDARIGNWQAYLTCHRRFAALKSSDSCPETIHLDVLSLVAALGDDYPLERLRSKVKCPLCGTASVEIAWHVPDLPTTPAPIQEKPPEPVRMRPRGAALAKTKLGVVKNG